MKVPSRELFYEIIEEARKARQAAAKEAFEQLPVPVRNFPDMFGACGGARLVLKVDGLKVVATFIVVVILASIAQGLSSRSVAYLQSTEQAFERRNYVSHDQVEVWSTVAEPDVDCADQRSTLQGALSQSVLRYSVCSRVGN